MRCSNCGTPLREGAKFCGKCGQAIAVSHPAPRKTSNASIFERSTLRSNGHNGRYSPAKPVKNRKKQQPSKGAWGIGILIVLIIVLLVVLVFAIRSLFSGTPSNEKDHINSPIEEEENINSETLENDSDNVFSKLGFDKQIIYVADGKSTYYHGGEDLSNVYTYEFSEDGFPLAYHYGYYNNFYSAMSGYYAYDTKGVTGEMISFINETVHLNESERDEQGEKYKKELDKILKEYEIEAEDVSYNILGITDNLVTTNYGGTVNSVMTYNRLGKLTERKTYWSGELFTTQTTSYIADRKPLIYEMHNENSGVTSRMQYTYEAGDDPVSVEISSIEDGTMTVSGYQYYTYDSNGNMSSSKGSDGSYSEYTYDKNGIILMTDSSDGVDIEYTYHYKKLEVDPDDVELLCNIYDHIGITYVLDGEGVVVTNTLNEDTMSVATADPVDWEGSYNLSMIQDDPGLYIHYSDGSFDKYYTGDVFTWDMNAMTYGADYRPHDLIMSEGSTSSNRSKLEKGQLVLVWPYDNRVIEGLYAVEESGYSLFRTDDEGDLEGLILTRGSTSGKDFVQWNEGHVFYWSNSVDYKTINGVSKENYFDYPSTEGRDFASFAPNETYTIGVVEGTALVEKEYRTNYMYYLHADETSPYTLTPTTDGYAVFDFSNTAPGKYVFTISRWDDKDDSRRAVTTLIEIN